jgi:hypothetical protein
MAEFTKPSSNGHVDADASEMAETIRQVDEAHAIPRPDSVGKFWIEYQTEEAETEQHELYAEKAEDEAAAPEKVAAEVSHQADRAEKASDRADGLANGETERLEADLSVLRQHGRRRNHAGLVYWLAGLLLVLGDVAGASGAILLLGEQVFNAVAQATSVAVSAVLLGGAGTSFSHWVAAKARQKPLEELTDQERACASFFSGPDSYGTAIKVLGLIFVAGVVPIVVGIFTLRQAAEGQEFAVAFGCFSFALCMASFIRSYEYACEVSDYLAVGNSRRKQFAKESSKASHDPVIARRAGARAEAQSVRARNEAASRAAARDLRRHMYGVFNDHPGVAGHGTAPAPENGARVDTDGHDQAEGS